ncbi:hypothetical protein [Streptomyces misionensis]|uniref:hypothetical protein n=1 Tax=Streptomyces misionensis TaxID=67331 RepID=UPI00396B70EA
MALPWGEYTFTCSDCDGDGSVQYVRAVVDEIGDETDEAELVWDKCDDCRGQGTITVDEDAAAEWIDVGHTPLRAPADYLK